MIDYSIRNRIENFEMRSDSFPTRIIAIVLLLAAPAGIIEVLSYFSDDPYLQPLDLKWEGIAASGEQLGFATIDVRVNWGEDYNGAMTQTELRDMIATTLESQVDYYRFEFHEQPGSQIGITFVVDANSYGPFPPSQMITGIKSAIIAVRMANNSTDY